MATRRGDEPNGGDKLEKNDNPEEQPAWGPPAWAKACPVCNAQKGAPCTAPTNTGRVTVSWYHFKRMEN